LFGGLLHEAGEPGFGWIDGEVTAFKDYPYYNNGWCRLDHEALQAAKLSRGLKPMSTFFFNHRYVIGADSRKTRVSVYRRPEVPAIYLDETICAVQFHPEKSQDNGRLILRNIIEDHYGL
jgi:glutamine amidotransferase